MTKEEFMAKLQMVYVGDKNAFNELIYAYDDMQKRNNKAIEYIKKAYQEDEDNKIPLEDLCLKNCTYNPSLVALSILQGEEDNDNY